MHKHSSSTSSSDSVISRLEPAHQWGAEKRRLIVVVVSTLLSLAVLDLAVGRLLAYPIDEPTARLGPGFVNSLRRYFEHGRSIEGKVRQRIGPTDATSHPLVLAGWPPDAAALQALARTPEGEGPLVAAYGMSFCGDVLEATVEQRPDVTVRLIGGPAATLGHSYTSYVEDRGRHEAPVVVLAVLASSFPSFDTMSHMTWNPEGPSPHMYPRYFLEGGELRSVAPPVRSLGEFRDALDDPERWRAILQTLETHDAFYERHAFERGIADDTVIGRLTRRAWTQSHLARTRARFHTRAGFTNVSGAVDTARVMLAEFGRQVRADGRIPYVMLFDDRGYADHLSRELVPTPQAEGIAYLSTHDISPASDLSGFVADGHFTDERNGLFAERFIAFLEGARRD